MLYVVILVLLTFLIPLLFTATDKNVVVAKSGVEENEKQEHSNAIKEYEKYDYGKYSTIKILHHLTNTVEEMNLDEYLYGVVSAEMPVDFELEALKAQAIVARTYTIYHILNDGGKHGEADICDNSACCQAWISKDDRFSRWEPEKQENNWNKIITAVNETSGKIITFEGAPINAFFHSNSGGTTEAPINVWGGNRLSVFAGGFN